MKLKNLLDYFKLKLNTFDMIFLSLLVGFNVVFTIAPPINLWNAQCGFGFIPIAIAAYYYGCSGGIIVAALGDILGTIIAPMGPYFPGFTLSAMLTGIIFGLFLFKNANVVKTVFAVITNQIICTLILNTYFISVLYTKAFGVLITSRAVQAVITTAVQIPIIILLIKVVLKKVNTKKQ